MGLLLDMVTNLKVVFIPDKKKHTILSMSLDPDAEMSISNHNYYYDMTY